MYVILGSLTFAGQQVARIAHLGEALLLTRE